MGAVLAIFNHDVGTCRAQGQRSRPAEPVKERGASRPLEVTERRASARAFPRRQGFGRTRRVGDGAVCVGGLGGSLIRLRRQDDELAVTRERLELDVEAAAVGMREGDADLRSAA